MKTQRINYATPMAFGALKRDSSTMTKALFNIVSEYPAVKEFGKKYDATLSVSAFYSSKNPSRQQLALTFDDIKPKGFVEKIKQAFSKKVVNAIRVKTHATNEEDFLAEIANQHTDSSFRIYNK